MHLLFIYLSLMYSFIYLLIISIYVSIQLLYIHLLCIDLFVMYSSFIYLCTYSCIC